MDYKEFMNKHSDLIGQRVWICDYRHNDIANKPIRHVKPTEVIVVSNDDLPSGKVIYYADIHFKPIGKKGTPLKQIIAPYDNTGYRSFTGTSLNIFLTKDECVEHYLKQCEEIKKEVEKERKRANERFDKMIEEIDEVLNNIKKSVGG